MAAGAAFGVSPVPARWWRRHCSGGSLGSLVKPTWSSIFLATRLSVISAIAFIPFIPPPQLGHSSTSIANTRCMSLVTDHVERDLARELGDTPPNAVRIERRRQVELGVERTQRLEPVAAPTLAQAQRADGHRAADAEDTPSNAGAVGAVVTNPTEPAGVLDFMAAVRS